MGNNKEALHLIIEKEADVEKVFSTNTNEQIFDHAVLPVHHDNRNGYLPTFYLGARFGGVIVI